MLPTEDILEVFSGKDQQEKALISSNYSDIALKATLNFISQILLEEDTKDTLFHEESVVRAMEKPFYDILSKNYPHTVDESDDPEGTQAYPHSIVHNFSYQSGSDNLVTRQASEFDKGVKEGKKFLPSIDKLIVNFKANKLSVASTCEQGDDLDRVDFHGEDEKDENFVRKQLRHKNKSNIDDLDHLEGRNRKVCASCSEETASRNTLFDKVLLKHDNYMKELSNIREAVQREASKFSENNQEEVDDIKKLLIQCSHAVYANDHQMAEDLIKLIRNQSSLDGDWTQRMAFAFADALEARLTGTGSEVWRQLLAKRISTIEFLKICQLIITVCPFPRTTMYYANQTILNMAKKTGVLHIVDLGIGFGFQWPSVIQALSDQNMKGIKLRITGVDFPRPGFRPAELVEEAGRRLEDYARSFNVPFEYNGMASKNWETISLDDLKIRKGEVLIVNCFWRLREIGDEVVSLNSPRDQVLKLIYKMKPHIFFEGVLSIQTFSPFFVTRFRQCLNLYSALFELLDILIPRGNKQRQIMERDFLARDILNVSACEGSDWTMKPETYKQWHQRNLRAGLEPVPLDPAIVKECRKILTEAYNNKIFFIEEDGNWLLQGWNGKAFDALSTWKPKLAQAS
ncbi:hypothetical protein LUZ62_017565 [Rhynchospora pubera]|uniref:GRAS family transcription factor n=1 Tax=Rhynchospora pubera TaxID=906938 RepID=A0AAV8EKE1_9POAL|nr:hypothetical protein LUZ62_063549 [Rhynchospora pubera]KAJ4804999.1 hypothetical protein LUZ62_017565 [Rhynchospora pubera]